MTDFELPDSTGVPQRLSDLYAAQPLVLLFYRGHW
jgi:peroxiredoxin